MDATEADHLPLLAGFKETKFFVDAINSLATKQYTSTAITEANPIKWILFSTSLLLLLSLCERTLVHRRAVKL
jgi:hypothetical protein